MATTAARLAPVPALPDDPVEEILLRFPPEDPASLARAALVCKAWRRLLSSSGFRRRFRDFHGGTSLVLGLLCSQQGRFQFQPTTASFRPRRHRRHHHGGGAQVQRALDARHGRVLLSLHRRHLPGRPTVFESEDLAVWDPVRGGRLQTLPPLHHWCCDDGWTAAIVSSSYSSPAAADGDDDDPDRLGVGPFRVVFAGTDRGLRFVTCVCVYSSEAGAWSEHREVAFVPPPGGPRPVDMGPSALVGNKLYFRCSTGILEHDLGTQRSDVIQAPAFFLDDHYGTMLLTAEDGSLALAVIQVQQQPNKLVLCLWAREAPAARLLDTDTRRKDDGGGWAQRRVIELGALLPADVLLDNLPGRARLVGSADGIAVVLVQIVGRLFTVDLKSCRVEEIAAGKGLDLGRYHVVPFVSLCTTTPALEASSSGVGPGASVSTASQT